MNDKVPLIAAIIFAMVAAIIFAIAEIPETDHCTPRRIEKYTIDMISYQDCLVLPKCIIEPKDIRYFRNAQKNFQQCVLQVLEDTKEKEADE